jgi:Family of unknown function (DUF5683)
MARWYVFSLVIGLLYIQEATALAATSQQKRAHVRLPLLSRSKAVVFPVTMSQVVDIASLPNTSAQQVPVPTVAIQQDDTQQRRYIAEEMVMQRAWLYSSVLPGSGQIYNKHYWKVPVIYVGFAGLLGSAIYYHKEYIGSKRVLLRNANRDNVVSLGNYVNDCRQGRDLCLIFAALWYIVNIFDAYVGASLKTFTLSDDISMEVFPNVLPTAESKPVIGISLTLSFNNENTPDRLWKDGSIR